MARPIILIDHRSRISYRNGSAEELLDRADPVFEHDGALGCHDQEGKRALVQALSELTAERRNGCEGGSLGSDRRSFRLTRRDGCSVAATVISLRPQESLRNFRRSPQVLFTMFEPRVPVEIDSYALATAFALSPAEARLTSVLVTGKSPQECARSLKVKVSTVRTQLMSVYAKLGASGQADLVRIVLSAASI